MWRPGVEEILGYYVYLLIDPRTDTAFYVGKGLGWRCFAHVQEARKTTRDFKGDYEKLATIRAIEDAGQEVRIDLLRHGLTEDQAFHVESAAIDLLGFSGLTNRVVGHGTREWGLMGVDDINAQYGAKPVEFDPDHRVILIRSSRFSHGMSEETLYETTRVWWRMVGGGSGPTTPWRSTVELSGPSTPSTPGSNPPRRTSPQPQSRRSPWVRGPRRQRDGSSLSVRRCD